MPVGLPSPAPASTALVTGASSGIGAAFASELASRGHGVTVVAPREDALRSLAGELETTHGVRAEAVACDLTDAAQREHLADRLADLGLAVEILVNNAGFGDTGEFARVERERMIAMVRLNVEAIVDLTARFLPAMVERGQGAVINVASTAAFQPMPGSATYAATKSFVLSHSEALHSETNGSGVTVTALCPGPVKTGFTEAAGMGRVEDRTPARIWMTADQVAAEAVRGAEKGRRVVVPGVLNQAGAIAGQHAPRAFALPFVKRVWRRTV